MGFHSGWRLASLTGALVVTSGCGATVVVSPYAADGGHPTDDGVLTEGGVPVDASGNGCLGGEPRCTGLCTDTSIDPQNCGVCGRACPSGEICFNGGCRVVCRTPMLQCMDGCFDVTTDPLHCGSCGQVCPPGDTCSGSHCHGPNDPTYTPVLDSAADSTWVDACAAPGVRTALPGVDDGAVQVPLPFAFRFWGTVRPAGSMVNVCSNGWLGMDGQNNAALSGMIPSASQPFGVVAVHWADLVLGPTGVCIATVGDAPARRFVVEWPSVRYYSAGTGTLTFEAVLDEASGAITLACHDMSAPRRPTAGTDDLTGSNGISLCNAGSSVCPMNTGDRVVLTPLH